MFPLGDTHGVLKSGIEYPGRSTFQSAKSASCRSFLCNDSIETFCCQQFIIIKYGILVEKLAQGWETDMAVKAYKKKMILILDGQGGGVGRQIAERLLAEKLDMDFIVVGTNAAATSNMMKAGVATGATGENAWVVNCAKVDIIVGPIGIILPNSMHGEISPKMALAVADSLARRVLIPVQNKHVTIVGLPELSLQQCLDQLVSSILQ